MGASPTPKIAEGSPWKKKLKKWWKKNSGRVATGVTLAGSIGTLFALGISLIHMNDSEKIMSESKTIIDSLSTQYLGPFPDSFHNLPNFVSPDQHSPEQHQIEHLDIMADRAYPGLYSARGDALKYIQGLESLSNGATVRLLVFSNKRSYEELNDQFSHGLKNEKDHAKDPNSLLRGFFHGRKDLAECFASSPEAEERFYQNLGLETFKDMMMYYETDAQNNRLGKTVIEFSNEEMPVFVWLRHDRDGRDDAIFAIHHKPSPDEHFTYYFKTRDQVLLRAYQKLFDSLWTNNGCTKRGKCTQGGKVTKVPFPRINCQR